MRIQTLFKALLLTIAVVGIMGISIYIGRLSVYGRASPRCSREMSRRMQRAVSSLPTAAKLREVGMDMDEEAEAYRESEISRSEFEDEISELDERLVEALADNDPARVRECTARLLRYRKLTLLNALRGLVRHGEPIQRQNALYALAVVFGAGSPKKRSYASGSGETEWTESADFGVISDGIGEPDGDAELAAQISHDIVCAVEDGLQDASTEVQAAAFDALMSLNEEERGVLSQQIISGDDADMKRKLIAAISSSGEKIDLMLSISAMDSDDALVRAMANNNIRSMTGESFATQEEALDWVEERTADAVKAAEESLPDEAGAEPLDVESVSTPDK